MPAAIGNADLRISIPRRLVQALDDFAKVRSRLDGKKVERAEIVAEALDAYFHAPSRMLKAGDVAELADQIRQLKAQVTDQIERGFAAMADADSVKKENKTLVQENRELREENEVLNTPPLYSPSIAADLPDADELV